MRNTHSKTAKHNLGKPVLSVAGRRGFVLATSRSPVDVRGLSLDNESYLSSDCVCAVIRLLRVGPQACDHRLMSAAWGVDELPSSTVLPRGASGQRGSSRSEIQVACETADRMGFDIRGSTGPDDAHATAHSDVGLAIDADRGGVGGGDQSLTVGLDVAMTVRENDGAVFCADPGVVGADDMALTAGIDGAVVERFDVSMFVGSDPGVVGRLDEAPAGGCDGAAGDSRAGLSDNFDLDFAGDVTKVQPVLRVGVDDDAFRFSGEALGVFRIAADRRCGAATTRPT